jgi:hypothetical protein
LFVFRRRPGWQKLRVVSFLFPLIPGVFIISGIWVTFYGLRMNPVWSAIVIAMIAASALIYHFHLRHKSVESNSSE